MARTLFRHPWFSAYIIDLAPGKPVDAPARPRPGKPQVIASMLLDGSIESIVDRNTGATIHHDAWMGGTAGRDSIWRDSAVGDYVLTAGPGGAQFLCICRKCDTDWQVDLHDHGGDLTLPAGWVAVIARGTGRCSGGTREALWCFGPFPGARKVVGTDDIVLIGPPA